MGFYFQDDFWEGVQYLPENQKKDYVFGIVSYYFTLEEPDLKREAMGQFVGVRSRVRSARLEADKKKKQRDKSRTSNGTNSGTNPGQTAGQNADNSRTNSGTCLNKDGEGELEGTSNEVPDINSAERIPYTTIIEYLNQKTGKSYRASSANSKSHIKARWNEGFRLEDFKAVIDAKVKDWAKDPKMDKYLRPQTLFGSKFEAYLNEKPRGGNSYAKYD